MNKHTPAPWNVDLDTGEIISGGNGGFAVIGTIYGADNFPCNEKDVEEECKANASLIASAPELLEALQKFANMEINTSVATFKEAQEVARAAIKKATNYTV